MTPERAQLTSELVRELRTPLARIALAAEELAALARHPAQAELAARIEDALLVADASIERVLALLREQKAASCEIDAAAELARMRERVVPALAARGIEWPEPEAARESAGIRIDATRLRRGALCLLRIGARALAQGGWLRIDAASDGARGGLRLTLGAQSGTADALATSELRAGAATLGASLELGDPAEPRSGETPERCDPRSARAAAASAALWFLP
jgi:hypothetical protein